jgi:Flp pilus assembly CpaF family ATPase
VTALRDLALSAYGYVDSRLRALEKAETGLPLDEQQRHAAGFLDEWVVTEGTRQVSQGGQPLNRAEEQEVRRIVLRRLFGLGDLEPLLEDDDIENVYVNGYDDVWLESRSGPMRHLDYAVAESDEELIALVQRLAAREGIQERRWDPSHPILDLTLRDGSRLHAVREVSRRPTVTIRLHRLVRLTLEDWVRTRVIDERGAALLKAAILGRQTVVISGATGAGKSAAARSLATCVPPDVRIVTLEDTYELHIDRDHEAHPNCIALQARRANIEGRGRIAASELFEAALRMAPGVLIVGEVRHPDEVEPMLDATGAGDAAGSISTIHARSPLQAISRFQSLARRGPGAVPLDASAHMVADAIDFVIHIVARRDSHGRRRRFITSVVEITGVRGGAVTTGELMRLGAEGPEWVDPISDRRRELLAHYGYDVSRWDARRELYA